MTGTEKIKAKILRMPKTKPLKLRNRQGRKPEYYRSSFKGSGNKKAEILKKAEAEGQEVYRRLISVAGLEARKEILKAKQDMVEEAFAKAVEKLRVCLTPNTRKCLKKWLSARLPLEPGNTPVRKGQKAC